MGKRRVWLVAVVIVLAVPVSALGALIALLDPNDYKQQVIDAVQHATGRALILNGPLRVSRSLWPTIEAEDVMLANLPGGSRPDMARAERIEAQVSLPALLWHRIEILDLSLVGPNVLFEQVGDTPNWTFERSSDGAEPQAAAPGSPFQLRIRNVSVRNGLVTSRLPARTRVVGAQTLSFRHRRDGGPVELAAVLVYGDNQPFRLQASAQPTSGVDDPWNTTIRLTAFDSDIAATGTMTLAGTYDLQVDGRAGALEKLNALLPELRLPPLRQAIVSTHVTSGQVPGEIPTIGATRLHFDGADLAGRVPGLKLGATDVTLPVAGGTATVRGGGQLSGQAFTVGGTFGVPKRLEGRVNVLVDLMTSVAKDASLALKGNVTLETVRFAGLDATAAMRAPNLAALADALPALTEVRFDGRVMVPAQAGHVSFKDAKLVAREGEVAGDGTIGLQSPPALQARLKSTRLDLDALLKAFGVDLTGPRPARPAEPVIPDTKLPWESLRGPSLDLVASVDALTFDHRAWPKADLALQLKGGVMDTLRLKLAMPSGPVEMSMTANASGSSVPVSLTIAAPSLPLALIAGYAGLPGAVNGTVRVNARLHAAGHSLHELAASLDGTVSATAVDGRLSNAAFVQLTAASLEALGIEVPPQGETALRCFGLVGSFSKGVGTFPIIALETTFLQLEGVGQVDFGRETLALKLKPLAQVAGSAVSVPVLVEGPFHTIQGRLDADGIDKLGFLFDGLFGGDKPEACAKSGLVPAGSERR